MNKQRSKGSLSLITTGKNGDTLEHKNELAKAIVAELTNSIARAFRKDEIIFIFDGSHSSGNPSKANLSDIDLTTVIPLSTDRSTSINLKYLEKFTSAIREGLSVLEKEGIYAVVASDYSTEAPLQDLAKYYISSIKWTPLKDTNVMLIGPVFCSSVNAVLVQASSWPDGVGFWMDMLSGGILQYGTEESRSKVKGHLITVTDTNQFRDRLTNKISGSITFSENLINSAYLLRMSNINLPDETTKADTLKKLKIVGVQLSDSALHEKVDSRIGPWWTVMKNIGIMPEYMQALIRKLDEARTKNTLPTNREIKSLYRAAITAIDCLITENKDIFGLYKTNQKTNKMIPSFPDFTLPR